jgi:hypothetical protein
MSKDEYRTALQEIVFDGLGFDAIRDLAEMLANYDANMLSAMKELKAEHKAIKKICEGDSSNKEKVQTVLGIIVGE